MKKKHLFFLLCANILVDVGVSRAQSLTLSGKITTENPSCAICSVAAEGSAVASITEIKVYDLELRKVLRTVAHGLLVVTCMHETETGATIAFGGLVRGGASSEIAFWGKNEKKITSRIAMPENRCPVGILNISADLIAVLVRSRGLHLQGEVILVNINDGKIIKQIEEGTAIWSIAYCKSTKSLVTGRLDGIVSELQIDGQHSVVRHQLNDEGIGGIALSEDGKTLAMFGTSHRVQIWELPQYRLKRSLQWAKSKPECVTFGPGNGLIACSYEDGLIKVWDAQTIEERASVQAHDDRIQKLLWSSDGKYLISSGGDKCVKTWMVKR